MLGLHDFEADAGNEVQDSSDLRERRLHASFSVRRALLLTLAEVVRPH